MIKKVSDHLPFNSANHSKFTAQSTLTMKEREMLDNADLRQLFNVSRGTLWRWRRSGLLPYYKIAGRVYYKEEELTDQLKRYKKI
jgi:hypothetical protein